MKYNFYCFLLIVPLLISCGSSSDSEDMNTVDGLIGHYYGGGFIEYSNSGDTGSETFYTQLDVFLDNIRNEVSEKDSTTFGGIRKANEKTTAYDLYLAIPTSKMTITTTQERDSIWNVKRYITYSYPAGKYLPQGYDTIEIKSDGVYHRGVCYMKLDNYTKVESKDVKTISKALPPTFDYTGNFTTQQDGDEYLLINDIYTFKVETHNGKCVLNMQKPEQYKIGELRKR